MKTDFDLYVVIKLFLLEISKSLVAIAVVITCSTDLALPISQ